MEKQEFLAQLRAIVGTENVIFHPEDLLVYEYDGSIDRSMPEAVVLPICTEEVSKVLALAFQAGVPVAGRGSGTGLSGGAIAPPGGIQVGFSRMNRILEVDTENRTATVEPGVINLDLDNTGKETEFLLSGPFDFLRPAGRVGAMRSIETNHGVDFDTPPATQSTPCGPNAIN